MIILITSEVSLSVVSNFLVVCVHGPLSLSLLFCDLLTPLGDTVVPLSFFIVFVEEGRGGGGRGSLN